MSHSGIDTEKGESKIIVALDFDSLEKALALVDIRVLDHVIIGDETTCLSEQGLL